jgi:hypothetical protein
MSLLAPPTIDIPELEGPELPPEPSPGMQKVMNLSRAVHLQCCIERARRLVDDAALYAATSRVYGEDMQADFDHAGTALRLSRDHLRDMASDLRKVIAELGKELAGD